MLHIVITILIDKFYRIYSTLPNTTINFVLFIVCLI